jgi:hypothetical protein
MLHSPTRAQIGTSLLAVRLHLPILIERRICRIQGWTSSIQCSFKSQENKLIVGELKEHDHLWFVVAFRARLVLDFCCFVNENQFASTHHATNKLKVDEFSHEASLFVVRTHIILVVYIHFHCFYGIPRCWTIRMFDMIRPDRTKEYRYANRIYFHRSDENRK